VARSSVEDAGACVQGVSDGLLQACVRWVSGFALRAHLLSWQRRAWRWAT
jgi:hypothetical protein